LDPGVEVSRGLDRPTQLAPAELGVDHHAQQGRRPHPVISHQAKTSPGNGTGQVVVGSGQVEPGRGQQRLDVAVTAEQEHFGFVQATLEDTQLGQGDGCVPGGTGHRLFDGGVRPLKHLLGFAPAPDVTQQRRRHAVAVAAEERLGPGGRPQDAALVERPGPCLGPLEVAGVVTRRVEGAHGHAHDTGVLGATSAGQGHGLVDHAHPLGHLAGLHSGEATVGQGLDLQIDVAEAAGTVER
jgi:hypothetical protein